MIKIKKSTSLTIIDGNHRLITFLITQKLGKAQGKKILNKREIDIILGIVDGPKPGFVF